LQALPIAFVFFLLMKSARLPLVILFASSLHAADVFLVEKGRPRAEIVIAEAPTRSQKLAAEELRTYVEKITGAQLPVVTAPSGGGHASIFVGASPHTSTLGLSADGLTDGAYRIKSGTGWLALIGDDADFVPHELHAQTVADRARVRAEFDRRTGARWDLPIDTMDRGRHAETGWWQGDHRGSLHAVHDFLRRLGVRWFMPGPLGEVVPKLDSIRLSAVDLTVRPDFALRQMDCNRWDLISKDEILWHLRLGLNWDGDYLGNGRRHGIQAVLGREEMKREHPEYYALWGGKRQTDYNGAGAPCLSAEGLLQEHVRYIRAMFDLFDEPVVDIAFPDNMGKVGKMCECEACRAQYTLKRQGGGLSDYVWDYMNRVAAEVARTHPQKKVCAYAYQSTLLPPEKIAKLHPNLAVIIATVWRHERLFPERTVEGKRDMDGIRKTWAEKVTSGVMYNWEYYLYPRFKEECLRGVPLYFPHGIAADLKVLKATAGMRGEFMEVTRNDPQTKLPATGTPWGPRGELYAPGFSHLNLYVTSRFYWDALQDVDALLADYYDKFYGPAAKPMQAFIEYCEQNWPSMTGEDHDPSTVQQMQLLLTTARAAAGDTDFGKRIDLILEYVQPVTSTTP
jgi:hypothetical protein